MNEDEKSTFFVSRRGRQVGVHEVDMNGIDIESPASNTGPDDSGSVKNTKPVKKLKENKVRKEKTSWSKKKKLILLAVVLIILVLPIIIAELVTAQYKGNITVAKNDMKQINSSQVLPAQKKTSLSADQLKIISTEVTQLSTKLCRGGLIDNIAQLYPRAKEAHDECRQSKTKYVALSKNLTQLEIQARYLEKVGTIIKPISTPITDEFAVIGDQQAAWTKAKDELNRVSPPVEYKSVHSELVTRVGAVSTNWLKLGEANASQDKASFEEAEKNLNVEYEAVRLTSSEFSSILATTQTKVINAYSATK